LHVTEVLWPDFSVDDFHAAIRAFAGRERRFGGVLSQSPSLDRAH